MPVAGEGGSNGGGSSLRALPGAFQGSPGRTWRAGPGHLGKRSFQSQSPTSPVACQSALSTLANRQGRDPALSAAGPQRQLLQPPFCFCSSPPLTLPPQHPYPALLCGSSAYTPFVSSILFLFAATPKHHSCSCFSFKLAPALVRGHESPRATLLLSLLSPAPHESHRLASIASLLMSSSSSA